MHKMLGSIISKFDAEAKNHMERQSLNPFSGNFNNRSPSPRLSKDQYGKPLAGSKTEERGQKAKCHILREILDLCNCIHDVGVYNKSHKHRDDSDDEEANDDEIIVTFGEIFQLYQNINDKVVGLLIAAKKRGFLFFDKEILFQRRDDDVLIALIKPIREIRATITKELTVTSSPIPFISREPSPAVGESNGEKSEVIKPICKKADTVSTTKESDDPVESKPVNKDAETETSVSAASDGKVVEQTNDKSNDKQEVTIVIPDEKTVINNETPQNEFSKEEILNNSLVKETDSSSSKNEEIDKDKEKTTITEHNVPTTNDAVADAVIIEEHTVDKANDVVEERGDVKVENVNNKEQNANSIINDDSIVMSIACNSYDESMQNEAQEAKLKDENILKVDIPTIEISELPDVGSEEDGDKSFINHSAECSDVEKPTLSNEASTKSENDVAKEGVPLEELSVEIKLDEATPKEESIKPSGESSMVESSNPSASKDEEMSTDVAGDCVNMPLEIPRDMNGDTNQSSLTCDKEDLSAVSDLEDKTLTAESQSIGDDRVNLPCGDVSTSDQTKNEDNILSAIPQEYPTDVNNQEVLLRLSATIADRSSSPDTCDEEVEHIFQSQSVPDLTGTSGKEEELAKPSNLENTSEPA